MKHLKIYKQKCFNNYLGFSHPESKTVAINLTKLHEKYKNEKTLIKAFSKTIQHEYTHIAIRNIIDKRLSYSELEEEKIVRKICGEKFPEKDKNVYSTKRRRDP